MSSTTTLRLIEKKKRAAAGGVFAIALNQVQIHQTRPLLGSSTTSIAADAFSNDRRLWVYHSSGLLRPIFRCLGIDSASWPDLETTATSSHWKSNVGPLLKVLAEESDSPIEVEEQEIALSKDVDTMVSSIETSEESFEQKKEKHRAYAHLWREKFSVSESMAETKEQKDCKSPRPEQVPTSYTNEVEETIFAEASLIGNHRKVAVLYELLSACLSDTPEDDKKSERPPKGKRLRWFFLVL